MRLFLRFILLCAAITVGTAAFVRFGEMQEMPRQASAAPAHTLRCVPGGCSGQLCVDASHGDIVSTCEWTPGYACYRKHGICEAQPDGTCGWTWSAELMRCLDNPEKEFPQEGGLP